MRVLAINPGGTSMRVAVYDEKGEIWNECIELDGGWIRAHPRVNDQYPMREAALRQLLLDRGEPLEELDAVVGRGGNLMGIRSGAYRITPEMLRRLREEALIDHASNLGAPLAYSIAQPLGIPSFIYDSVAADELIGVARITGLREIRRRGRGHNLSHRAAAHEAARQLGVDYYRSNFIIAHLGSGISLAVHSNGRIIDVCPDDEGTFSPERAGLIPPYRMLDVVFAHHYTKEQAMQVLTRSGGLVSLTGSTDFRELEKAAEGGDDWSRLVYEAMAYNIAKDIGKLSAVVSGQVAAIVITGSIARSRTFTDRIASRVSFIAPVCVFPGEFEMKAMAEGALRVLQGLEQARTVEEDRADLETK